MSNTRIKFLEDEGNTAVEPAARHPRPGHRVGRWQHLALDESELKVSRTGVEVAAEWLLFGLLAFMPLAFGAVELWSETIVVAVTGLIAVCVLVIAASSRETPGVRTWALLPMILFILLAVVHLTPLPVGIVKLVSPESVALRERLMGAVDSAGRTSLSLYPQATLRDLRIVLVASTLFVSVLYLYRTPKQITRLLIAIAVIGGVVALVALVQQLGRASKIYWVVSTPYDRAGSGPFVNYSHYCQFMNLSIGAAFGLLLVKLREKFPSRATVQEVVASVRDGELGYYSWIVAGLVVGVITVCLSMSRGGVLSMLIAFSFTAIMITWRQKMQGVPWLLLLIGLMVFVALLYVGFDAVVDRLGTLATTEDPSSGRLQIYRDAVVAWKEFPLVGTGIGTWETTYPMFNRSLNPKLAEHADSDYVQMLMEGGAVGLLLVLGFAGLIWLSYARAIDGAKAICTASFGLGCGLLAVMIHSATDFGQHLPAIAGLSAVTCALLVRLASMCRGHRAVEGSETPVQVAGPAAPRGLRLGLLGRLVLPAAITASAVWAFMSVNSDRHADNHWRVVEEVTSSLQRNGWRGSDDDFTTALIHAGEAVEAVPADVYYRYWQNQLRWRSISREVDPETGDLLLAEEDVQNAERIADELYSARALCPTYGPLYSLAGQLEAFVLERWDEGVRNIRLGFALAPTDPDTCLALASVEMADGRWEESKALLRRYLALSKGMYGDVLRMYLDVDRLDLAIETAGNNPSHLFMVINAIKADPAHADATRDLRQRLAKLLEMEAAQAESSAGLLATVAYIHREQKDFKKAASFFAKALAKNYDEIGWRLDYARTLADDGQMDRAMHEARLAMRLRPQMKEAQKVLEELERRGSERPRL